MNHLLRFLAMLGMTHVFLLLMYGWKPLANAMCQIVNSRSVYPIYAELVPLLDGPNRTEAALLCIWSIAALLAAIITIWIAERCLIVPVCRRLISGNA